MAFTPEGERLIGDAAKNQLTTNPENTIFDVKRLIGREWSDPTVQHDVKLWPFKVFQLNCFSFVCQPENSHQENSILCRSRVSRPFARTLRNWKEI